MQILTLEGDTQTEEDAYEALASMLPSGAIIHSVAGDIAWIRDEGDTLSGEIEVSELIYLQPSLSGELSGFRLKLPKLKLRMPKIRFRMPKFKLPKFKMPKFKMPKLRIKMPNIGKQLGKIGKNIERGVKSAAKAWAKPYENAAKAVTSVWEGAANAAGSLLQSVSSSFQAGMGQGLSDMMPGQDAGMEDPYSSGLDSIDSMEQMPQVEAGPDLATLAATMPQPPMNPDPQTMVTQDFGPMPLPPAPQAKTPEPSFFEKYKWPLLIGAGGLAAFLLMQKKPRKMYK